MAKANRRRRKIYTPLAQGDTGPMTAAQMEGAVLLSIREDNGAEFRRKRRDHALEIMASTKCLNGKPKQAEISTRQRDAGLRLHALHCVTEMSPDASFTRVYVDASPNPGAVALAQAERLAKFIELSRHIPRGMSGVVWHVAIRSRQLRDGFSRDGRDAQTHCAQLQVALDILANHLSL